MAGSVIVRHSLLAVLAITPIVSCLVSETADCQPLNRSSSNLSFCSSNADSGWEPVTADEVGFSNQGVPLSSSKAVAVSIFPGIFFHGVGHLYARQPEIGFTLLGLHVVTGGIFMYLLLGRAFGEGGSGVSGDALLAAGLSNAAVWLADIVGSVIAVHQHNQRLDLTVDSKQGVMTIRFQVGF